MQVPFDTSEIIPDEELVDIVTTGLEGGYSWFVVDSYRWQSGDGSAENPWAVVSEGCDCWEGASCEELVSDDPDEDHKDLIREFPLTIDTVRAGVDLYVLTLIDAGWKFSKVISNLEDYDLNVADSILQCAVWKEQRYA